VINSLTTADVQSAFFLSVLTLLKHVTSDMEAIAFFLLQNLNKTYLLF